MSFIPSVTCTTQIHQPITFDYFEHQRNTDKWTERVAHARAGTIETTGTRRWEFQFFGWGVFSGLKVKSFSIRDAR